MNTTTRAQRINKRQDEIYERCNAADKANLHTPGPWYQNAASIRSLFGRQEDKQLVATVSGLDCESDEFEANARLIAAAPTMLEALKAGLKYIPLNEEPERPMIEAAIAKAEGRSK